MRDLQELIPNLWSLELTGSDFQTRALVVLGEQRAVVWDTLTHPNDMKALTALLADKPYYVVYSHGDWDHIWGTAGLTGQPLALIAHAECLRRFADDVPRALQRMQLAEAGRWDSVRLAPPNLTFSSSLSLDLGGVTLELHHTPGHTIDSIVGWIPEWGVLLGGDAIETPLPVVNSARLLGDWLAALEGWAGRDSLVHAISAHGSGAGREALETTVAYLRALIGDRKFELPNRLEDFYRETHQKNLSVVDGGPALHD